MKPRMNELTIINVSVERLGVVASPKGFFQEEGVLNPAVYQDRDGNLLVMMRSVAKGNQSRLRDHSTALGKTATLIDTAGNEVAFERVGFALVPQASFERRRRIGESGKPKRLVAKAVKTLASPFIPELDRYVMCYTAFGLAGPRIALARSHDGYQMGIASTLNIPRAGPDCIRRQKTPPSSPEAGRPLPSGAFSLALYHRPMVNMPRPPTAWMLCNRHRLQNPVRGSIRIAYVPREAVRKNIRNLTNVSESQLVFEPLSTWGSFKCGAGTAPLRIKSGWLEVFHGVDQSPCASKPSGYQGRYAGGIIVHDINEPHKILYVSDQPVIKPETKDELEGIVNNVVFPTGIVERTDLAKSHWQWS